MGHSRMPVCSKGHAMGAFDVEDEDIVCDFCGDAINVAGFACIPCDYDVCRACGNKWWATGDRRGNASRVHAGVLHALY